MTIVSEQTTFEFVDALCEEIGQLPGILYGISLLPKPGFVVRAMACDTHGIEALFSRIHRSVRKEWLGKEELVLRKY